MGGKGKTEPGWTPGSLAQVRPVVQRPTASATPHPGGAAALPTVRRGTEPQAAGLAPHDRAGSDAQR